jgi:hypothetical protein
VRMGPDVIRADLSTTQTRLRAGGGGYKVRKWCSFGGGVWEVWRMGSVGLEMHRGVCKLVNRRGIFPRLGIKGPMFAGWDSGNRCDSRGRAFVLGKKA